MTGARARFYVAVMRHLWQSPQAPTPQDLASWMASQRFEDPPPDLPVLLKRLRAWPAASPYPPIPDDEALFRGVRYADGRWMDPGSSSQLSLAPSWLTR